MLRRRRRISPRTHVALIAFVALVFGSSIGTVLALDKYDPDVCLGFLSSSTGGGIGTGTLYVYTDPQRTTEAPANPAGNYIVIVHTSYYFSITDITEYSIGQTTKVWAVYQDQTEQIGSHVIGQGGTIEFTWTIPGLSSQTETKYKYGLSPNPEWRFAKENHSRSSSESRHPAGSPRSLGLHLSAFRCLCSLQNY